MRKRFCMLLLIIMGSTISYEAKSQAAFENRPPSWVGVTIGSTKAGVSQLLLNEYSQIVARYIGAEKNWWIKFKDTISLKDRSRLEQIFKQMSAAQQLAQKVAFINPAQPLKKVIPSEKDIKNWKNEKVYGVWINGKKVNNAVLNNYANTDFHQVTTSRLYGNAKRNKKYSYQVNLMTSDYYSSYYSQTISKQKNQMVFRD